jgi:hypothetical protein
VRAARTGDAPSDALVSPFRAATQCCRRCRRLVAARASAAWMRWAPACAGCPLGCVHTRMLRVLVSGVCAT